MTENYTVRIHTPSFEYVKTPTNIFGLNWLPVIVEPPSLNSHDWIIDFNAHSYDIHPHPNELHWSSAVDDAFRSALRNHISTATAILEIGVLYKPDDQATSSTITLLDMKRDDTKYVGLDLNPKTLDGTGVHTIQGNSFDHDANRQLFADLGITQFDIICIDGNHSLDAAFNDWKYVDLLAPNGLVCIHDTNHHPGPFLLMQAIDTSIFEVWEGAIETTQWEWGIGFARKR